MAWFDDIKSFLSSFTLGKNPSDSPTNPNIAANNDDGLEDFMDTTWSCYWVKF